MRYIMEFDSNTISVSSKILLDFYKMNPGSDEVRDFLETVNDQTKISITIPPRNSQPQDTQKLILPGGGTSDHYGMMYGHYDGMELGDY